MLKPVPVPKPPLVGYVWKKVSLAAVSNPYTSRWEWARDAAHTMERTSRHEVLINDLLSC
jgi:hypothetical protein